MGSALDIRLLQEDDQTAVRDFLLAQDPESLRSRFACPIRPEGVTAHYENAIVPALEERLSARLGGVEGHVVGTFDANGSLVAIAEIYLFDEGGKLLAEAAFLVDRAYRGAGVGKLLMVACHGIARHRGAAAFKVVTQPENMRMRRLASSMGLAAFDDGVSDWCAQRAIDQDEAGTIPSLISFPGMQPMLTELVMAPDPARAPARRLLRPF